VTVALASEGGFADRMAQLVRHLAVPLGVDEVLDRVTLATGRR
jgi:hypothetical protein